MRVECEKLSERVATPELICELVRDGARRGEFMIMMHDDDDEAFVQIACDFDQVEGADDGCFDLEYREGEGGRLFHCARRVSAREVEAIFLDEYDGRVSWRDRYTWELVEGYGPSSSANGFRLLSVKNLAWILPLVFVLVYAAHAAYLWRMYGPPTGFCTKCTIYWGKHRILHGNHHQVEHAPLLWSCAGKGKFKPAEGGFTMDRGKVCKDY